MTAPLAIQGVPIGGGGRRDAVPLTVTVPAHQAVALLGDEESGLGRLGGYALGLEPPPAGHVTVFDTIIADLPERERLAVRRRVG
jgi:predicted ABC-type transport system involved in lysophospholipase L1 biosynthesis ATPase subunit